MLYNNYMIVGEHFKNVEKDGAVTGFQVGVRLPYYRGIVLSLVGEISLTVDGEKVPVECARVTVGGNEYPLLGLENEPVAKWEFGEIGILTVERPGGLASGDHTLELQITLRISYVPVGFRGQDKKVLRLAA